MKTLWFWCACAVTGCIMGGLSGCSSSSEPKKAERTDGHQTMVYLLDRIHQNQLIEGQYFGNGPLQKVQGQLIQIGPNGQTPAHFQLYVEAGLHQLRLGETEKAIDSLKQAESIYRKVSHKLAKPKAGEPPIKSWLDFQLAVAYLRLGENENCVFCRTGESCLLPIKGSGVHEQQEGARNAITYLRNVLKQEPNKVAARWLLNIAYMAVGEYPDQVPPEYLIDPQVFESDREFPRFTNVAGDLKLDTMSLSGGTIVDDFDGDGFLDVVNSTWNTAGQIRFFRNNGDGTFTDQTENSGLKGLFGGLNLVHADYDNDGDLDIYVLRGAWLQEAGDHPNSLLQNDGNAVFRDVTFDAGLGELHYPTQTASWADFDRDGDLDLFVGNEGYPSQLFENLGDGTFRDIARSAGVHDGGAAKGVIWGDFDNDDWPDLYVSNLAGPNRLFRNNGDGTFTDVADQMGVTGPERSFPVWFWDVDNDGKLDIYAGAYWQDIEMAAADFLGLPHKAEADRLYLNRGADGFRDASSEQNVAHVTLPMGSNFGDLNNDGFPDYYLGTGYPNYEGLVPNRLFVNRGGSGFDDVSAAAGFSHLQKGHGVSFADIDNDGDQDVFIELGGAYPGDAFTNALFENPGFENNWLTVRLIGRQSNRYGVGCRIRADISENGQTRTVYKWLNSGGSFGANPLRAEIGLGRAEQVDLLEVHWPTTGKTQQFRDVPVNQFIEITEGVDDVKTVRHQTVKLASPAN